jgi:hypothetical protein
MRNAERAASYRKRAVELRKDAEALADKESKRLVLEIADRFDELAQRLERTIADSNSNWDLRWVGRGR